MALKMKVLSSYSTRESKVYDIPALLIHFLKIKALKQKPKQKDSGI